jgi:hypothetical protein
MTKGASSRHGRQKTSKAKLRTDWTRLQNMSDGEIRRGIQSDADVHPTDEKFWKDAKIVLPRHKPMLRAR